MLTRVLIMLSLWLLACMGMSGNALADPGNYVLVSDNVELTRGDDGTATIEVSLINLTNADAKVSAAVTPEQKECRAAVDSDGLLRRGRQSTFKITVTGCSLPDKDPTNVKVVLDKTTTLPTVSATPTPGPDPDWHLMGIFFPTVVGAGAVVGWAVLSSGSGSSEPTPPLKHLKDGWTLKDSVAADVTFLATAFTGVFGATEVLKELGDKTGSVLALATVASAVGLGLVGAASFVVQAFRKEGNVTTLGLWAGSTLTLGGTAGQLWVVLLATGDLDLGSIGDVWLYVAGGLASLLLGLYGYKNTVFSLKAETKPPLTLKRRKQYLDQLYRDMRDESKTDGEQVKLLDDYESLVLGRPATSAIP
ncbi:hypothetical protein OG239_01750 [Streptomyces sp. NBC_00868]|uniref:hypothetical protein n=1 Tax=Streptomyces sp. NBC_00868 TaxID=2903683 RepID=UPI00386BFB0D|nr:hypothetical protein OG239_01750 [Streptomyces sp. NBC_00868]